MKGDCTLPDGREVEYEVHIHSDFSELMSCCLIGTDEQLELTDAEGDFVIDRAIALSDAMWEDYYDAWARLPGADGSGSGAEEKKGGE